MDNTIVKNITSQGIDKTAIKNFAVYARNKLIKDIKNKAAMIGVTESGIQEPLSNSTGNIQLFDIGMQEPYRIEGKAIEQRNGLIRELKKREQGSTYLTAYETLIEEVAYTWFNRIIAVRFMEVNNYMPDRMRVLSSGVEGINEPEFITHVFETSFQLSEEEKEHIIDLKTDSSNLAMDELFQYLFIKQCNALNANLPELFEKTNDYTELLLTVSYNDIEGVIYKLVHDVPEMNFDVNSENGNGQVEIIGWLYQYYNSDRKDEVINVIGKKVIKKEDIPAATQLFTTDWVVRYMVDNSLGKYWLERNPHSDLVHSLEYLVSKDIEEIDEKISPEDIKFLDNCMGSGHILVYAFDVLMKIYESEGYTTREAAKLIIEKNLYGLEIDKRSYQLSYFAIMMKGRQYNRRILNEVLQNNLYVFQDSTSIDQNHLQYLGIHLNKEKKNEAFRQLNYLIKLFENAEELGSIIIIEENFDAEFLLKFVDDIDRGGQISFETIGIEETQTQLRNIVKIVELLKQKYEVVVTNPPYMNKFDKAFKKYVKDKYKEYSGDLFSVFIYRNFELCKESGYSAYMAPNVWMFIKSHQKLREYIIENKTIDSLIQMAKGAFYKEATVDVMTFVIKNELINKEGYYIRLEDSKGGMEGQRIQVLEAIKNAENSKYFYFVNQSIYKNIPGMAITYWLSNNMLNVFKNNMPFKEFYDLKVGVQTGDNDLFYRKWWEVNSNSTKWVKCNKSGEFRKWYGNLDTVINWENNGLSIKSHNSSVIRNTEYYFREGVAWSNISSREKICGRYEPAGMIFDQTVPTVFSKNDSALTTAIAYLNSKVATYAASAISPTLHFNVGEVSNYPFKETDDEIISILTKENVRIAKSEWDDYETSWDFTNHIFTRLSNSSKLLEEIFCLWNQSANERFDILKKNEESLEEIFISMYGLEEELDSIVNSSDITLRIADKEADIRSFISYAIGVIFGRYTLDEDGIAYAGGNWDSSCYRNFQPIKDNILVVSDDEYFGASSIDIVNYFVEFLKIAFSEETLEKNLQFISDSLGGQGTSRQIIRKYFVKSFYKDHLKIYQNRPIYWLYDSGKQNGFKALVYMHRYDEDTTGKVRVDYLHQVQRAYERTITTLQEDIANSKDAKETTQLQKQLEKITKQLKECRDYDERLGHMALERVAIDLDDGVKVNYQKVQTDSKGKFHQILAKIK